MPGDVSARDDEHAPLAKRRQACREVEVVVDLLDRVQRQLEDGDVGIREPVDENAPRSVIDAPGIVVEASPPRLDRLDDLLRDVRAPGAPYSTANNSSGKPKKSWIV